ncbi:hypothetical protein CEXT_377021 [Caerostris extrusa]|uniref:Uncharacterized protein n=1 Tax=Caerostris extrusa TaxID=172846 RepID=A0AAV4W6D7_CAEEX|nr:hypothetical protein CEXT_377021 [Caerostris extrusa]
MSVTYPSNITKSIFLISFYLIFLPIKISIDLQANKPLTLKNNLDFVKRKKKRNPLPYITRRFSVLKIYPHFPEIRLLRILPYGSSLHNRASAGELSLSMRSAFRALGRFQEISRFYRETWVFEFGEDATSGGGMNPFPDCVLSVLLQMHLVTMKNTI